MIEQPVNVNRIAWRELFPWTLIFRTLPVSISVTVLVLATIGVVLVPIGWIISEQLLVTEQMRTEDPYLAELAELNRSPYRSIFRATESADRSLRLLGANFNGPRVVFENLVKPVRALFRTGWSTREYSYFLIGSIWTILVWSFLGMAIARVCVLRLTRDEALGIDDAFDFALEKYKDCLGAVVMPLGAIAAICIPLGIAGLFLGFDTGVFLVGLFWFLILFGSAIIVFLLVGLFFGWPLIVASVSTEGQNSFDAVTRAFAYVFQRPLNYALYALVAILFGGFCWIIASTLTNTAIDMGYWATSWGANLTGEDRIEVVKGVFDPAPTVDATADSTVPDLEQPAVSSALRRGRAVIGFWNGIARTLAAAFIHGLFWCMATSIYLLLRRDVDETEMDEVYLVDEKRTYDLPPLKSDEHGIPTIQEPVPSESSDNEPGMAESPESTDDN